MHAYSTAGPYGAVKTIAALQNTGECQVLTVKLPTSWCSSGTAESRDNPLLAQYLLENIIIAGCMDPDVIFFLSSRGDQRGNPGREEGGRGQ